MEITLNKRTTMAIANVYRNAFLQCYSTRCLRCSGQLPKGEETWKLWDVNKNKNIFALTNWRYPEFLQADGQWAFVRSYDENDTSNHWKFIPCTAYGLTAPTIKLGDKRICGVVAIRSVKYGYYMGAIDQDLQKCGGEAGVGVTAPVGQPVPPGFCDVGYIGWWILAPCNPSYPELSETGVSSGAYGRDWKAWATYVRQEFYKQS